jgi:hypothetical protein
VAEVWLETGPAYFGVQHVASDRTDLILIGSDVAQIHGIVDGTYLTAAYKPLPILSNFEAEPVDIDSWEVVDLSAAEIEQHLL